MAWTSLTAPPPYFGVAISAEPPTVAHGFDYKRPGFSLCGVRMRLMGSRDETELPTCEACYDLAVYYEKNPRSDA